MRSLEEEATEEEEECLARLCEEDEDESPVRTLEQEVGQEDAIYWEGRQGYKKIETEIDTGSCVVIMPTEECPGIPIEPSPASKAGKKYRTAGAERIANEGQSTVRFWTEEGARRKMLSQRGKVNKALAGGGPVCDQGNTLLFTARGGAIIKDPDEAIFRKAVEAATVKTPFHRNQGGTYSMNMWVPINAERGRTKPKIDEANKKGVSQEERTREEQTKELEDIQAVVEQAGWTLVRSPKQKKQATRGARGFPGQD